MKFSLTPGPRRPLDRKTAWGCLTTNQFGLPGLGSLAAGRVTGYAQMVFSLAGLGITAACGFKFVTWYFANWSQLQSSSDPTVALHELWLHLRWPALGLGIFLVGWLWALASSISILSQAKSTESHPVPPRIQP